MQSGKRGMGSHKHGTSGRGGPSPGAKMARARDANRLAEDVMKKLPRPHKFASIAEALAARGQRSKSNG